MKDVLNRIEFHLKMRAHTLKSWWEETVLGRSDEIKIAAARAAAESISQEEKAEISRTMAEWSEEKDAKRPVLDPRRTMLIFSKPEEHACNTLTATAYRLKLLAAVKWAQERGITTFLTDYYTPLGLLALETLVELKEAGTDLRVYAVHSTYLRQRRSYRAIKETPLELIYLSAQADYCYTDPVTAILMDVVPSAWTHCTEQGIWVAENKIPPYLLEAWKD